MDKTKKKHLKRYLTWAALAGLVALLTVMPLIAQQEAEADGPVASILTAQAEITDLSTALHGGGTLSNEPEEVNLPTGVKIEEFLVKNGQTVQKGTPLARVDKVSVMETILCVNETMEYLREELEDARNETVPGLLTAAAGGRVKQVFAQAGDSVQDVMLQNGCLAVLSLDGRMAVTIQADSPLTTGQTAAVILADGTPVTGRVESNLAGQVVLSMEDEGYAPGQEVEVEGLGRGTLYVHNAWKVTAYSGTVSSVSVRPEQTVSTGATLFQLKDRDYDGELRRRANQHREYEQLLQRLLTMYESGTIDAPCEGMVSGVDEDSPHLLAATGEEGAVITLESGGWALTLLSSTGCTGLETCTAASHTDTCLALCSGLPDCTAKNHKANCQSVCTLGENCKALSHNINCVQLCRKAAKPEDCLAVNHFSDCIHACTNGTRDTPCHGTRNHSLDCIENCTPADCAGTGGSEAHQTDCIRACSHANAAADCAATASHYLDCIRSCTGNSSCTASKHYDGCPLKQMYFTARVAKVDYVGTETLGVYWDRNTYPVEQTAGGWQIASPDFTGQEFLTKGEIANPGGFQKGDVIMLITGYDSSGAAVWSRTVKYSSASAGTPDFNLDLNMNLNLNLALRGFSGLSGYSGASLPQEELYDRKGSTLMVIQPLKNMTLEVPLDEQDISRVQLGAEATVTVEALKDQVFPATVTWISAQGTNSGGSSKFRVKLELEMTEDMIPGMSAAARLPLEQRRGVLTIPAEALWEDRGKTYVYTALDKDSGEPAAPVEVTTGLSDGDRVQILSGLEEGSQVCYRYYNQLEFDHSAQAEKFTFG